ncbi:sulfotransferase family cytosolic 1B member 1 isoform X2 [Aplysia californica]|uniref:Sulfotransferase family cytosolic 1B member 1 isoform X2 n=1 Tax=Aplysia californica TaxID=6500 RepID=A0ABM1W1Q4_APLCA|nr:sulfotransferase family cytosolic 1B member 1 isoform X2 [Aplysia californica]
MSRGVSYFTIQLRLPALCHEAVSHNSSAFTRGLGRGTTWLQELVYLIDTNLDFEGAEKNTMDDRFPFFEFPYPGKKAINDLPSPRRIKTHLPFPLLPNQMKEKKPKIIYIARNPKDTLVSLYHFAVKFFAPVQRFQGTYDQFCELFAEDKAIYGPWWKHVLEAWKCRDDDNVLVLFYEDLQKDLPGVVRQVASFLGKSLTDAEVDAVAKHCTFESMKNNKSVNYDWLKEQGMASDKADFMRKGKVGDWKNHLSSEISAKLEEMVSSKLTPAGVVFQDTLEGSYGQDEDDML